METIVIRHRYIRSSAANAMRRPEVKLAYGEFRAVVFDLFGTLILPLSGDPLLDRIATFGIKPDIKALGWVAAGYPAAALSIEMGVDPAKALKLHLTQNCPSMEAFATALRERFPRALWPSKQGLDEAEIIAEIARNGARLVSNAAPLLDQLGEWGISLSLFSNLITPFVPVIERSGLSRWFRRPQLSCEIGATKPSLPAFRKVINDLRIASIQTLMVGDNWGDDVLGAVRAGMSAAFLDPTGRHPIRRLLQDARVFLEVINGRIRFRPEISKQIQPYLPVTNLGRTTGTLAPSQVPAKSQFSES